MLSLLAIKTFLSFLIGFVASVVASGIFSDVRHEAFWIILGVIGAFCIIAALLSLAGAAIFWIWGL